MKYYQNEKWLREKYWEDKLSQREIAKMVGRSQTLIRYWMEKHDIPRRTTAEAQKNQKRAPESLEGLTSRFWGNANISTPSECWEWQGARKDNYGIFYARNKRYSAHRMAWELTQCLIPEGLCICHKCDNPACVNPNHLFLGTKTDNNHDRDRKGRATKGESHPCARLTKAQIIEIRNLYSAGNISQRELAQCFSVSCNHINNIINRKKWKHI